MRFGGGVADDCVSIAGADLVVDRGGLVLIATVVAVFLAAASG